MARSTEVSQSSLPAGPDQQGWRHWGDGLAGKIGASRIQGFYAGAADYRDVAVDASGNLQLAANVSVDLGTVDQGAAGASAWPVSVASLPLPTGAATEATLAALSAKIANPLPVSLASVPSHPVTNAGTFAVQASWASAQHVIVDTAPTTAVTGTFFQGTQPVSIASMPSTPVTGTFWQGTQPVSIASMPSTPVTGTFWQGTQPVSGSLGRSWTLGSGSDSVSAVQSGTWTDDVTDRAARLLGHVTVDNASLPATQSGSWSLSGSDGLIVSPVSARQHNGYTHLYVRDAAAIGVLSELVNEIRLMRKELHV